MVKNKAEYIDSYESTILPVITSTTALEERKEKLKQEVLELNTELERLIHDNATRSQDQIEYVQKFDELSQMVEKKRAEISSLEQQISELLSTEEQLQIFLEALRQTEDGLITTFRASTWHAFVDYAAVMADKTIEFHMRNGSTLSVPLIEAQRRI